MILHYFLYLLSIIGVLVFNVFFDTFYPYVLNVIFITVSGLALIIVLIHRHGINVGFYHPMESEISGNKKRVQIQIENRGFLPISFCKMKVRIRHSRKKRPVKINYTALCAAGQTESIDLDIRCLKCELITIEIHKVLVTDYLKVLMLSKKLDITTQIVVLPNLPAKALMDGMYQMLCGENALLYSQSRPGDDPSEIYGIREYGPGDKIRNIHWKMSAKFDDIMVKEHSLPIEQEDLIYIDIFKMKKENYDVMFSLLYGLICVLLKEDNRIMVGYYQGKYETVVLTSTEDICNLFAILYEIQPYEETVSVLEHDRPKKSQNKRRVFYLAPFRNAKTDQHLNYLGATTDIYYLGPEQNGEIRGLFKINE